MLMVTCAVQSVVCRQDLTSKPLMIPLCIIVCQFFILRALSRFKHDMDTLSWLSAETLEKSAHPSFGRLVSYSAHLRSFMKLHNILYRYYDCSVTISYCLVDTNWAVLHVCYVKVSVFLGYLLS